MGRPNSRPNACARSASTPAMLLPSLNIMGGELGATPTRSGEAAPAGDSPATRLATPSRIIAVERRRAADGMTFVIMSENSLQLLFHFVEQKLVWTAAHVGHSDLVLEERVAAAGD